MQNLSELQTDNRSLIDLQNIGIDGVFAHWLKERCDAHCECTACHHDLDVFVMHGFRWNEETVKLVTRGFNMDHALISFHMAAIAQ